jgi:hypothetical protein
MLEVLVLLQHRRFIDVVVGSNAVGVREFGNLAYISIIAANVFCLSPVRRLSVFNFAVDAWIRRAVLAILTGSGVDS